MFNLLLDLLWINNILILLFCLTFQSVGFIGYKGFMYICTCNQDSVHLCPFKTCIFLWNNCRLRLNLFG
jgi:hypothetical protein